MAVLTCKICGGHIISTGVGYGICDTCDTEVTLPVVNHAVCAEYYNRGNHFRSNREFDQAYKEFEHIIAQDAEDAEAYWSLVLCKYGVVYELNPETGKYDLIVTNIRQEPIWEDIDYRRTLKCCDEHAKALYRAEAGKIDELVDQYFSLTRKMEPYDVFLCVLEFNSNAARVAQTVYVKLVEKGLRVFRESAMRTGDTPMEREAHIAYALTTAKLMFAITAGNDDLNTQHLRQQWIRFLELSQKDRGKKIIPVYTGTDTSVIPQQIPIHEAICADLPGYWQDLTWGAQQLLGKAAQQSQADEGTQFMEAAKQAFGERNYTAASVMAEQALNYDPNNAYAHYYILMSKHRASGFEELFNVKEDWAASNPLQRIISLDKGELGQQAQAFRTEYCNRTNYQKARNLMNREVYGEAVALLEQLGDYRDAPTVLERCRKLRHHQKMLQQYRSETENNPYTHLFRKIQRDHSNVFNTLVGKLKQVHSAPRAETPIWKLVLCLVLMVGPSLATLVSSLLITGPSALAGVVIVSVPVFLAMCACYGFGIRQSKFKGICMLIAGFMTVSTFIGEPYDGLDNLIICIFPVIHFIKEYIKERDYANYLKDLNDYTKNTLNPLEKSIVTDIGKRYGDVLTDEELGSFCGVRPMAIDQLQLFVPKEVT